MAELNITKINSGLKLDSDNSILLLNEYSTKINDKNRNELAIISRTKDNYAEYIVKFSNYTVNYYSSEIADVQVVSTATELQDLLISGSVSSEALLKINGRNAGTLFGDDVRTTSRIPVLSGNWCHGLPLHAVDVTINGTGRWFVEPDVNDSDYFDGVSSFETGTDADGKIFVTSKRLNRYHNGHLSYFEFTAAFRNLDSANGNFILLFGAMSRGAISSGNFDSIKEGVCLGYKRDNGNYHHIIRIYKNFEYVEDTFDYDIELIENLKILRLEFGYLGIHPVILYRVNPGLLQEELRHLKTFDSYLTNVSNPNLALGVYIENLGNTTNLKLGNGSFQFGNYSRRSGPDPSSRNLVDAYSTTSVAGGSEVILAVYSVPEVLEMYKEINSGGNLTGNFNNTVANKLKNFSAYGESSANKVIEFNIYIAPKSDFTATYTVLNPYINTLERAVGAAITGSSLANANKIAHIGDCRQTTIPIDVSSDEHLLTPEIVGVITVFSSVTISSIEYTISTEDLF